MAKTKLSGVAFKSGPNKGKHKSAVCKGLNSGGANKGRLKKGYKWTKSSTCPVPVSASAAPAKKRKSKASKPASKAKSCAGLVSSGAKKGRLKKGFKFKKGSRCPVKAKG